MGSLYFVFCCVSASLTLFCQHYSLRHCMYVYTTKRDLLYCLIYYIGTWELLWTTQDPDSPESKRFIMSWINPLENQSYSNNPRGTATGRADPVLPLELQNKLEKIGILTTPTTTTSSSSSSSSSDSSSNPTSFLRSTQTIDSSSQQVVNVVALKTNLFFGKPQTLSLTVLVDYVPNANDPRRIDVKFQSCRVAPLGITIPLGMIGPTGWLRTVYIDDDVRITRGHKGSVFILQRPRTSTSKSS